MRYDPEIHHRHAMRLRGYDYACAGTYFVTSCVEHRECLLGAVEGDAVILSEAGRIVDAAWYDLPTRFPTVVLDEMCIMPNHMHAVIALQEPTVGTLLAASHAPLQTAAGCGATGKVAASSVPTAPSL